MLEGTQVVSQRSSSNNYAIPSGSLMVFPFTLGSMQYIDVETIHTAFVQDNTICVWISIKPSGLSVAPNYPTSFWRASRMGTHVMLYDQLLPRNATISIALAPGNYYVNVHNLCNEANGFSLIFTTTQTITPAVEWMFYF